MATQVKAFISPTISRSTQYLDESSRERAEARAAALSNKRAPEVVEVCAQSVEFVAVPQMAARLHATLPEAIRSALQEVEGFAGCAVMVSEQEARLVTVVTFWRGHDRARLASTNAKWVEQLLDPYIDRQLRAHKLRAQIALQPETRSNVLKSAELAPSAMESREPMVE